MGRTIISGMEAGRILTAPEGVGPITVAGAKLTHGTNVVGRGAIAMPFGELTIRESVLTENTVHGAGTGGAVNMEGRTLNIVDSSITANSAAEGAGSS